MSKQTSRALNWQNRELDKQTKTISETASGTCGAASKMAEHESTSTLKELKDQPPREDLRSSFTGISNTFTFQGFN